jgi:DNA invertase Pin-like site-specific DNA recombinase
VYDAQLHELPAVGCDRIYQEHGSGASRARPVLTRLLGELTAGDVLVVVRLDRLSATSWHVVVTLLAEGAIEGLEIGSDSSLGRGFPLRHSADAMDMGGES